MNVHPTMGGVNTTVLTLEAALSVPVPAGSKYLQMDTTVKVYNVL